MNSSSTAPTTRLSRRYRHDLTNFVEFLPTWLDGYALGTTGVYTRHLRRADYDSSQPDAYGCAGAANILYMLGALPATTTDRTAWIGSLQAFQDPTTGVFKDSTHSDYHTSAHCTAALELFDARPAHELTFMHELFESDRLKEFLDSRDWQHPWPASHDPAGLASALIITGEAQPDWFADWLDWFDAEVDPTTGMWRRGMMIPETQKPGLLANLGASFHFHFVYDYLRQAWPYPDKVIDTCLTLMSDSSTNFAVEQIGFAEIDLIFCLSRARRQTVHRFDDVETALQELADRATRLLTDVDYLNSPAFDDVHTTFGAVCAIAELQRALPSSILTTVPLRLVLDRRPFI